MAVRCVSNERPEHNAGFDFFANQKIIPHPTPSSEIKTRLRATSRKVLSSSAPIHSNSLQFRSNSLQFQKTHLASQTPRADEVRCRAAASSWLHFVPRALDAAELTTGFAAGHDPPPPSAALRQHAPRGRVMGEALPVTRHRGRLFLPSPRRARFPIMCRSGLWENHGWGDPPSTSNIIGSGLRCAPVGGGFTSTPVLHGSGGGGSVAASAGSSACSTHAPAHPAPLARGIATLATRSLRPRKMDPRREHR